MDQSGSKGDRGHALTSTSNRLALTLALVAKAVMAIRRLAKRLETDKALARKVKRVEKMLFAKA